MTTSGNPKSKPKAPKEQLHYHEWESNPRHVAMKTILEVGPRELDAWVANVKLATEALVELGSPK